MVTRSARNALAAAAALLMLVPLTACSPDSVVFEIGNKTGGTLHNVKLTFPGDDISFKTLEDSTYTAKYSHFDGPGELTIFYTTDDGQTFSSTGPEVTGNEKGQVKVTISRSYANFDTEFDESQQ